MTTTLEKTNINLTLQQLLHNLQIIIINIKMIKESQNLYHHTPEKLNLQTQKIQIMTMKKKHIFPTKTITIIKFISHKNSQISSMMRKNMYLKHLNQQITMIINLKNKTIMKKNTSHIITSKINMNKYHPNNLAIKLKITSKLQKRKIQNKVLKSR